MALHSAECSTRVRRVACYRLGECCTHEQPAPIFLPTVPDSPPARVASACALPPGSAGTRIMRLLFSSARSLLRARPLTAAAFASIGTACYSAGSGSKLTMLESAKFGAAPSPL